MNLGGYIKELEKLDPSYPVYKEYANVYDHMEEDEKPEIGLVPAGYLHSWRGDYAKLSIDAYKSYVPNPEYVEGTKWDQNDITSRKFIPDPGATLTVAELLEDAKNAIGKSFEGYKGGDFIMYLGTGVYADNYSHCPGFIPVKFEVQDDKVVIRTLQIGWDY